MSTSSNDSRVVKFQYLWCVCVGGDKRQRFLFKCAYTSLRGCTDPWVHKHTCQFVARGWHGVSHIILSYIFIQDLSLNLQLSKLLEVGQCVTRILLSLLNGLYIANIYWHVHVHFLTQMLWIQNPVLMLTYQATYSPNSSQLPSVRTVNNATAPTS